MCRKRPSGDLSSGGPQAQVAASLCNSLGPPSCAIPLAGVTVLTVASPRRITGLRFFAGTGLRFALLLPSLASVRTASPQHPHPRHAFPMRLLACLCSSVTAPCRHEPCFSPASPRRPVLFRGTGLLVTATPLHGLAGHRFSVALPDFSAALPEFALLWHLLTASPLPALPTPLLDFGAVMGIS